MSRREEFDHGITADMFGDHLYHGTAIPGLTEINAREGHSLYPSMDRYYSARRANFVTNDPEQAAKYAEAAAEIHREGGHEGPLEPTVYRVRASRDHEFDVDPNSGPSGWNDGPDMETALELHRNGGWVHLRFHDPLPVAESWPVNSEQFKEHMERYGRGGGVW